MLDFEENIDLDALFDSLNVDSTRAGVVADQSNKAILPDSGAENPEFQQLNHIEVDMFLFDNPTDQS